MRPVPGVVGAVPVTGKDEMRLILGKEATTSAYWQVQSTAALPKCSKQFRARPGLHPYLRG